MTAPRSTFLLLLAAACFVLAAGPVFAEPVETPPSAPPAGAADEAPDGPPPGAAPEEEMPLDEAAPAEEIVEVMKALPGRMPSTDGPKIPSVIGRAPHETSQALSAWRVRLENVVTDRTYVGRVVDQHPDAGTTLAPDEVVTIVVGIASLPARGYASVPAIERLTLEDAAAALRRLGFGIMLRVAESYDADKGIVLAQAPRPASVGVRGQKVIVVVGKGGLAAPVEPVLPVEPLEPEAPIAPLPAPEEPPAGPPSGALPPLEEPPAMVPPAEGPPAPPPVQPPTEAPPTAPMPPSVQPPRPPAEAPPTAPVPPLPPTEEPPAMPVEPPAPVIPVAPPAPRVVLRVPSLVGPATGQSFPRAFGSTFEWKAVTSASTYEWELQVEASDGTWSTVTTESVEGTSYRPKRMEAGRFRWRVRALADEVEGEWSEFFRLYMYGP